MPRTISVKGMGNLSVVPDRIVISIKITVNEIEYDLTMNEAEIQLERLREAFMRVGFKKEDIKTTDFEIEPDYHSFTDSKGNYKKTFQGFECNHRIKIEFDLDMELLSRVLQEITQCFADPEFTIRFSVKNKEAITQKLLANAVNNAKERAVILADAAGITLGDILSIDYHLGEQRFYSPTEYSLAKSITVTGEREMSLDIEPEDIEVNDTVFVVWEIK